MPVVQSNSGTFNGATFNVTLPSAASAANRVVVIVAGNTTMSTPTGWTLRDYQSTYMACYLFDRAGDGTTTSWTFTPAAGQGTWVVFEVQNGAYLGKTNNPTSGDTGGAAATSSQAFTAYTPAAGTVWMAGSVRSIRETGDGTVTHSGWSGGFTEVFDLSVGVAGSGGPSHGVATQEATANGSTAYTPGTVTFSAGSRVGRSAALYAYSTTSGTSYTPTPADPVGITDTVAVVQSLARTPADMVGITDTSGTGNVYSSSPADPVGLTDSLSATQTIGRTIGDSVGIEDTGDPIDVEITTAPDTPPADTVGATDAVTQTIGYARTQPDAVAITDTASAAASYARTQDDPVGVTDTLGATASLNRTPADPVGVTDSVIADLTTAGGASLGDTVALTDELTVTLIRSIVVQIDDTVTTTDTAGRVTTMTRTLGDALGIATNLVNSSTGPDTPPPLPTHGVSLTVDTGPPRRLEVDAGPPRRLEQS